MLTKFETFEPLNEFPNLRTQLNRLMSRVNPDQDEELFTTQWAPLADVLETKDAIAIKVELPGMTEKDINVEMENGVITIRGERKIETETKDKGYRRIERSYGKFVRSFTLPPNVDSNKIVAAYNNGVLELDIPKKEEAKPKTIQVEVKKKVPVTA
jgi:HSP20 family protein